MIFTISTFQHCHLVTRVSQLLALLSTTRVIMAERAQGKYSVVFYKTVLGREALKLIETKKSSQ